MYFFSNIYIVSLRRQLNAYKEQQKAEALKMSNITGYNENTDAMVKEIQEAYSEYVMLGNQVATELKSHKWKIRKYTLVPKLKLIRMYNVQMRCMIENALGLEIPILKIDDLPLGKDISNYTLQNLLWW